MTAKMTIIGVEGNMTCRRDYWPDSVKVTEIIVSQMFLHGLRGVHCTRDSSHRVYNVMFNMNNQLLPD